MTQYLVMDADTAAMLAGATAGEPERLMPRAVTGGGQAGKFALPLAVLEDVAFGRLGEVLDGLAVAGVAASSFGDGEA
jgi:hypothetical protein